MYLKTQIVVMATGVKGVEAGVCAVARSENEVNVLDWESSET